MGFFALIETYQTNKINTLKFWHSEIRIVKLIRIDMIPKKLITYISVDK